MSESTRPERAEAAERPRGRPRDARLHAAILGAARELVVEVGYGRVTIEGVAKRAGVSRTTIYQKWGSRVGMLAEALLSAYSDKPVPDTGSFAGDLEALVREQVEEFERPEMARGFFALSADLAADREAARRSNQLYAEPVAERWRSVFARAEARGELPPGANPEAALDIVSGSIFMMARDPSLPRGELARHLLSVLLGGVGGAARSG